MEKITRTEFDALMRSVFTDFGGITLTEEQSERFYLFAVRLLEENEKYNLTAIRSFEGVVKKHFYDSVVAASAIPKNYSVIDIGTGAGFPSLPIAIMRTDLKITSLDSTEKKVNFVKNTAEMLGLDNLTAVFGRAEELASKDSLYRDSFGCAIGRSVAGLPVLCELCLPFVKPNGIFVAMKSASAEHEIAESENARRILGAALTVEQKTLYTDTETGDTRMLFVISKTSRTPEKYPRAYGRIKNKPL